MTQKQGKQQAHRDSRSVFSMLLLLMGKLMHQLSIDSLSYYLLGFYIMVFKHPRHPGISGFHTFFPCIGWSLRKNPSHGDMSNPKKSQPYQYHRNPQFFAVVLCRNLHPRLLLS